jgi:hypothetical protein
LSFFGGCSACILNYFDPLAYVEEPRLAASRALLRFLALELGPEEALREPFGFLFRFKSVIMSKRRG